MLLKENPFYVLNVSISADRRKIAEAAEECGFLVGTEKSSEAQSALISPVKRLSAELGWFPEASEIDIISIRNSISKCQPIFVAELSGYSKLNALIYNLQLTDYTDIYELGFDIVSIDEQYSSIEIVQIAEIINQARQKAGIAVVAENEVLDCHRAVIEDLRRLINENLKVYDEKTYIEFATVIAEQYIADSRNIAGPILFDVIDQYEIRMQSEIETRANQIIQYIDLIKSEQDNTVIRKTVPKVIERVYAWEPYAKPLQYRSKKTGLPHEISRKLAYTIRGLIIFLNNEKNLTSEARDLASAMKVAFLELGELQEVFSKDTDRLNEIEKNNEEIRKQKEREKKLKEDEIKLKEIETKLSVIDLGGKFLLVSRNAQKVKEYCDQVAAIHKEIIACRFDSALENKLRNDLCYKARSVAISLGKNIKDAIDSKYIVLVLLDLFKDIPDLQRKLQSDLDSLDISPTVKLWTKEYYEETLLNGGCEGQSSGSASGNTEGSEREKNKGSSNSTVKSQSSNNPSDKKTESSGSQPVNVAVDKDKPIAGKSPKDKSYRKTVYVLFIVVFAVVLIIAGNKPINSASSKSGSSTTKSASILTTKPTSVSFKEYTSQCSINDKVYIDVKSVFPEIALYTKGDLTYSKYVCKCETNQGGIVWVCFDALDYSKDIDSSVGRVVKALKNSRDDKKIRFSRPARIYGTVAGTSSLNVTGLEGDIGSSKLIMYSSIDKQDE